MDYVLTQHAQDAMSERSIPVQWLERVLVTPEKTEPDKSDTQLTHLLGTIAEHENRVLRVVVNREVDPQRVVTVYFDRRIKGKL